MKLSVIVVSLNAGNSLIKTVESILCQKNANFEIIIKDGESKDGSLDLLPKSEKIKVHIEKDNGIYDAMNQAIKFASGDYILFMNCGDTFYSNMVISKINSFINENKNIIYYGDCYTVNRKAVIFYPDVMNEYTCFSKTLCHQATIFPKRFLEKRKYQLKYKICADFEYYIHAFCLGFGFKHIPIIIVNYEGGGVSESFQNRKKALKEKKEILKENFSKKSYIRNMIKLWLHGGGIKQYFAGSKYLYGIYSYCAGVIYGMNKRK